MALGLIGQKLGMTRFFTEEGRNIPVSVVKVEPNRIVQIKTSKNDGYSALQVTIGNKVNKKNKPKVRRVGKAIKGHYLKAKQSIGLGLWELTAEEDYQDNKKKLDLKLFSKGQFLNVAGISKGKGFQGGVKRHNFRMQDATHGNSISHRALGSTGQCQTPGRVFKGKKMAGHMGAERVTQESLEVINIDNDKNIILIKGSIPGAKNGFVKLTLSNKKKQHNEKIYKEVQKKILESKAKAQAEKEAKNKG